MESQGQCQDSLADRNRRTDRRGEHFFGGPDGNGVSKDRDREAESLAGDGNDVPIAAPLGASKGASKVQRDRFILEVR